MSQVNNVPATIEVFKALADETRLAIVRKVAQGDDSVASCDICACTSVNQLSQPAMSHHFKKLVDAGVLVEEKRGTQKSYRLNDELLGSIGLTISKIIK